MPRSRTATQLVAQVSAEPVMGAQLPRDSRRRRGIEAAPPVYEMASIDIVVKRLGGQVYRRAKSAVKKDAWFDYNCLYPYEYVPSRPFNAP